MKLFYTHHGLLNLVTKVLAVMFLSCVNMQAFTQVVNSGNVEAELVSEYKQVAPGQLLTVLLKTQVRDGWHTYWKNPGDSGAPTTLKWHLPEGFTAGEIQWPYPERIPYGPLVNFGYEGEVLYPVEIQIPKNQKSGTVSISVDGGWLVCADICIPEDAVLKLDLLVGESQIDVSKQAIFQRARQKLPSALTLQSSFAVTGETVTIEVEIPGIKAERILEVSYFPNTEGVIDNPTEQKIIFSENAIKLVTATGYDYSPSSTFDGIIVIKEDAGTEIENAFEIHPLQLGAEASESSMSLFSAILFAFIGGLILNLMPCVFPVLSIKILSLMQETAHVRSHGWVYLLGVVLSFVAVAAVLIGLRTSGAEIGWGFQLQSPIVVSLLAYLFLLIALNLSGYFEIGGNLMNMGQGLTQNGYSGSFFTGVLATVVAAPCTAPFMASAIGYALTQNNVAALFIFASLGLGMATPYVLLCYSPSLLKKLPKPGPWMERAKELLAFPLYGSAVWLLWVLSIQSGSSGVLSWGVGALSLVFAIWLLKHLPRTKVMRMVIQITAFALVVEALYLPGQLETATASVSTVGINTDKFENAPAWTAYSEVALVKARAKGPVFIDFDAAWCITCKVNAALAIDTIEVKNAFEAHNITYLKGDWTNEDPAITRKLAEYGRSGVPLYLLYSSTDDKAQVLPQILTKDIILAALNTLPK